MVLVLIPVPILRPELLALHFYPNTSNFERIQRMNKRHESSNWHGVLAVL
jgi:hypothetical protein